MSRGAALAVVCAALLAAASPVRGLVVVGGPGEVVVAGAGVPWLLPTGGAPTVAAASAAWVAAADAGTRPDLWTSGCEAAPIPRPEVLPAADFAWAPGEAAPPAPPRVPPRAAPDGPAPAVAVFARSEVVALAAWASKRGRLVPSALVDDARWTHVVASEGPATVAATRVFAPIALADDVEVVVIARADQPGTSAWPSWTAPLSLPPALAPDADAARQLASRRSAGDAGVAVERAQRDGAAWLTRASVWRPAVLAIPDDVAAPRPVAPWISVRPFCGTPWRARTRLAAALGLTEADVDAWLAERGADAEGSPR